MTHGLHRTLRVLLPMIASVILLSAALSPASAQSLNFPAGSVPGELRCPHQTRPIQPRPPARQNDVFQLPSAEELAGLGIRGEAYSQEIFLGERRIRNPSKPFAIGFWGDSHAASNYFSEEMVRALGLAPEMVRPTFIPPTMDRSGVRLPIHKYCQSAGWSFDYAYAGSQANAGYAKGLANLKSNVPNSYLWVDFRSQPSVPNLRSVDVLYVPPVPGKKIVVGIIVDDAAEQIVELNGEEQGVAHIYAERPVSIVKLRVLAGTFVLQGLVPHYADKPALYLDTFGIPGATVRGWKALNPEYLKTRGNDISYDLVILEYGTNEGNDSNLDPEKYRADLRASLKNLRQVYPQALCVLIGPTDRGVLVGSASGKQNQYAPSPAQSLLGYSRIHQMLGRIQADVGNEFFCSFWSWQDAMGGPGGAYFWMRRSPALMARDLTHLTIPGYQLSAREFVSDTRLTNYVGKRPY